MSKEASTTPQLADEPIEALAQRFLKHYQASEFESDNELSMDLIDASNDIWDELKTRRPKTTCEAAALVRIVRHWLTVYEGDTAGVIDEPWPREMHEALGRVQTFLK